MLPVTAESRPRREQTVEELGTLDDEVMPLAALPLAGLYSLTGMVVTGSMGRACAWDSSSSREIVCLRA